MNTRESLNKLEELTEHYLQELNSFSIEDLRRQPDEEQWSLGQMYLHLIGTALNMQIRNVRLCESQNSEIAGAAGRKSEAGEAVFANGGFPPTRIKVPASPQYTPAQPESKEQIVQGLQRVLEQMREIEPTLETISPDSTAEHPRLGAMQAKEWFLLVEMHYRHHLQQEERLQAFLSEAQITE